MRRALVWFRSDLRVHDNPALSAARRSGEVVALFILAPRQWRAHGVGDPRFAFLLRCLAALRSELGRLGIALRIERADAFADHPATVGAAMRAAGADVLHFNAEYPLDEARRDRRTAAAVRASGCEVQIWHGNVLVPPGSVRTGSGGDYTVFTPFRRRLLEQLEPGRLAPLPSPPAQSVSGLVSDPVPGDIEGVRAGLYESLWPGGERTALARLEAFLDEGVTRYADARDRPDLDATSRLSPYFAIGALSPRLALQRAQAANDGRLAGASGAASWINEVFWREFYHHVVAAFPHVSRGQAFRRQFDALPWRADAAALAAWKAGRTGYPLVDAGMRQLAATGWMHNRLRMVVAMFLSKHLLIDWREGERHFMNLLVDGDFAANNGGWQWSASTGTDAAPYFRVFNPVAQAKKYDPDGTFVRAWVPELAQAGPRDVFEPWRAPLLHADYPSPIVDHRAARERAIAAFRGR